MPNSSDDALSTLLGNDPIATSVSVRIRQDEQTLSSVERRFKSLRQEAEGIAKAWKEAGAAAKSATAGKPGSSGLGSVGDTPVAGSAIKPTPLDKGLGFLGRLTGGGGEARPGAEGGRPRTAGLITPTPLDKGVGTQQSALRQQLGQVSQGIANSISGAPPSTPTQAAVQYGIPAVGAMRSAASDRADRNREYSLQADRMTMLYQQMTGMSQQRVQDVYRQPLTKYKLGPGGINTALGLEASTGLKSSMTARDMEAMRVASGFTMTAQDAAGTLGHMASPEVVNRMYTMTGTSLIGPGGVQRSSTEVMQDLVKKLNLTDPNILKNAAQPGSVTRANMSTVGVTGALQDQLIQYAKSNLAYQDKGGKGMYDPADKSHQKRMGISDNFAMQAEETERVRGKREEEFYSRQADNFSDLEKQTQALIKAMAKLEDVMSPIIGAEIGNKLLGGALTAPFIGAGKAIGSVGSILPSFGKSLRGGIGWLGKIAGIGDFVTADAMERRVMYSAQTSTSSGSTWGSKTQTPSPYIAAPKTTTSGSGGQAGIRLAGPQQPSGGGLNGFKRNTRSSFQDVKPKPFRKMLSREITDAEMDEAWGMIPPSWNPAIGGWDIQRYSDIKRQAIMAYTPSRFRNKSMTLAELSTLPEFLNMHPTTQRAFQDAAIAASREGKEPLGLQSGWRSPVEQHNLFISRYQEVGYDSGIEYQGKFWAKKDPSYADVAVPGAAWSNHEHGLALDVIGDKEWLGKNAHRFGLEGFKEVNDEDWHFQIAGLREKGTGGGAGYNERTGFTSPSIEMGQDGYKVDGVLGKNNIIQSLYNAGIKTSAWTKNVNGVSTPIGIDFMPVRTKGGYTFKKVESTVDRSILRGSADAMERWITGGKKGMPPPAASVNKQVGNQLANGTKASGPLSMDQAAKMLYDAGFRGKDLVEALAIMWRESNGDPSVINNSYNQFNPDGTRKGNDVSYGLFQHNFNPSQMDTAGNVRDWQLSGSPEDWAAGSGQDLYDPARNIALAFERYAWDKDHGGTGWGPWVNDGVSHLYGAENFIQSATEAAMRVGVYTSGDYVPQSATTRDKPNKPTPIKRASGTADPNTPLTMDRLRYPSPSVQGLAHMSDQGILSSGSSLSDRPRSDGYRPSPVASRSYDNPGAAGGNMSTPIVSGSNTITVSPTININASGSSMDQDLEGMARKIAAMLEKEVNRVALRRT